MFMDGFGGIDGIGGWDGINNPTAGLLWQLFEESGQPGYYMLFRSLDELDEEETDHRRD